MTGNHSSSYENDILLWSEQQAEVIRRLGRLQHVLPNELDIENVAEEIESVGRSELASVESQIQNLLVHLIKLHVEPDADVARHWRAEILSFHGDLMRRFSPSMRQRIDMQKLWRLSRKIAALSLRDAALLDQVREDYPFDVNELIVEDLDIGGLVLTLAGQDWRAPAV